MYLIYLGHIKSCAKSCYILNLKINIRLTNIDFLKNSENKRARQKILALAENTTNATNTVTSLRSVQTA